MKRILYSIVVLSFLTSCGGDDMSKKKATLDKLKQEQSDLTDKIRKLETELAASDTTQREKIKNVATTAVSLQPFTHYIEVQAMVEGDEDVTLSAQSAGTITAIHIKAGDKVAKGQVLATIDDKIIRQGMAEAQSNLDLLTTIYNRQKNLWDQKIGSEVQFLQAKTGKEAAEKRMNSLQEQWELTRIKAPFNGTVDNVAIKTGQNVAPGIPAVRIVNLSELKVKGELPETYIGRVQKGNDVIVFFPDMKKEIKTKVYYSGNAISSLNRTFNVEVRFTGKEDFLRPNMTAVLKIADYAAEQTIVLPIGAVQKGMEGEFVFIAQQENGKTIAKRKLVKSGNVYNGLTEIKEGLNAGDKIITTGYQNLVDGDLVKI
jgi:RND family efflux transporter MFP subunit